MAAVVDAVRAAVVDRIWIGIGIMVRIGIVVMVRIGIVVGADVTYTLIVFLASCGVPCEPIWVDDRELSFVECRTRRDQEMTFYLLRDERVWAICRRNDE